jgi:hypothetical protein
MSPFMTTEEAAAAAGGAGEDAAAEAGDLSTTLTGPNTITD